MYSYGRIAFMDTEKSIVDRLVDRYNPKAIILYGSRAQGKGRPKSDWDIALIFNAEFSGQEESVINGQYIDLRFIDGSKDPDVLAGELGSLFFGARVLYETDGAGFELLSKINEVAKSGPRLNDEEIVRKLNFVNRSIERLEYYVDDDVVFAYHLGDLYTRLEKFWYLFRNEWSKPIYLAANDIQGRDPEYFEQLSKIAKEANNEEKLKAVRNAYKILLATTSRDL